MADQDVLNVVDPQTPCVRHECTFCETYENGGIMVVFWPHEVATGKHRLYPTKTMRVAGKTVHYFSGLCPMFDGKGCKVWDDPSKRPLNCYIFPMEVNADGSLGFVDKELCPYVDEFKTEGYEAQVRTLVQGAVEAGDKAFLRTLGRCPFVDRPAEG
jgi:hypothetical protein